MDVKKFHELLAEIMRNTRSVHSVGTSLVVLGIPAGAELIESTEELIGIVESLSHWLTDTLNGEMKQTKESTEVLVKTLLKNTEETDHDSTTTH